METVSLFWCDAQAKRRSSTCCTFCSRSVFPSSRLTSQNLLTCPKNSIKSKLCGWMGFFLSYQRKAHANIYFLFHFSADFSSLHSCSRCFPTHNPLQSSQALNISIRSLMRASGDLGSVWAKRSLEQVLIKWERSVIQL